MNSALIVIDVQESFRQRPNWKLVSNPAIVDQVDQLVAAARARGDLVVWILHAAPGAGTTFDPASGHVRLIEPLCPRDGEPVLTKTSINAFTTTRLQQILTRAGVRELVICGIQTEQCCETTTRLAADLGYRVTFVTEATATFPIPYPGAPTGGPGPEATPDPRTLDVRDIIARTEYVLAGRFATIATVAELTGASGG